MSTFNLGQRLQSICQFLKRKKKGLMSYHFLVLELLEEALEAADDLVDLRDAVEPVTQGTESNMNINQGAHSLGNSSKPYTHNHLLSRPVIF